MTRYPLMLAGALLVLSPAVRSDLLLFPRIQAQAEKQSELSAAEQARKDSLELIDRMAKAETRALFRSSEPLTFTLIANYGVISRDRDTLSTKRFDGTLVVKDSAGVDRSIPVRLRTRGHFRLLSRNCRFVPLRIDFPDSGLKGTPFAGQKGLKLGTHCQNDGRYDDITRREYLAYRLFNVLTEKSFRARLATATYVDSANGKTVDTRTAMFLENEDELARRFGGKIRELRGALFDDVQPDDLLLLSIFEYMIGNTDWSLYALHNIRIAQLPNGTAIPLAYDFDFSGLADAHYATPDPRMGIRNVRERKYRGPCRPEEEVQKVAAFMVSKRAELMSEIDSVPGITKRDQSSARAYLEDFFFTIGNPTLLKRSIVDACERRPGM